MWPINRRGGGRENRERGKESCFYLPYKYTMRVLERRFER
jgi:hypothetical protein